MKKHLLLLLLLSLFVGLTACTGTVHNDYTVITPHIEQPLPQVEASEEALPLAVTNRTELRGAVLSAILDWTEQTDIPVRSYTGEVSQDLQEILRYATEEYPIGAYAVDYMDGEFEGTNGSGSIRLSIVFRRSAAEIDSIVTVSGTAGAQMKIRQALAAYDTALTLRIRSYEETDFAQYIYHYCLEHPSTVIALPTLSAEVYPKEGDTRILELHFSYPASRDEMRLMQTSVQTVLDSASSYIRSGEDALHRAQLLYRFLTTRFDYTLAEKAPVMPAHSLLHEGVAHGLSFASVFQAECAAAELDCRIVFGERNGAAHYWNLLYLDGSYYHVDLLRSITEAETELQLLYDEDLQAQGYRWPVEEYEAAPRPEPPMQESTEPTEGSGTEPTESTEPTEETAPTQEATQESTQPTEAGEAGTDTGS